MKFCGEVKHSSGRNCLDFGGDLDFLWILDHWNFAV